MHAMRLLDVAHPRFDKFVLVLIFLSSVLLIADSPLADPEAPSTVAMGALDLLFSALFTLEAALKIYGDGWRQYIASGWNQIDFLSVCATQAKSYSSSSMAQGTDSRTEVRW